MSLRNLYAVLFAVVLSSQTGCHCGGCWPCGKNWCGSQCGEVFWNEWFSLPPDCCDPCSNCGAFQGPNNRFLRRGVFAAREGAMGPYADDGYGDRDRYPEAVEGRRSDELPPGQEPPRSEELPAGDSTSDAEYYNEFGQRASFEWPVDSPGASRKLGRPPRSRVVAR